MKYVLSIDQSTQGTKALLFNEIGALVCREDIPHKQIIDENGWVSHDPEEIYQNLLQSVRNVVNTAKIAPAEIACMGISNQRETTVAWDRSTGKPICNAIVWQCSRSKAICERVLNDGYGPLVQSNTGIPVSPYFPASKIAWILETIPGAREKAETHSLCFGTVDTWLVYKLTGGMSYKTDYSNASRTQLLNLHTLQWDEDVCNAFGIPATELSEICDSDSLFGVTDLDGLLPYSIPIHGVLGDSHAALFGQGCHRQGMVKATYGTGSSVMMNIGEEPIRSQNGLVTSLAWKYKDQVQYVMEGNLNYTGAVISWLKNDLEIITSPQESQALAEAADPADTTYLVPAFTGLGAPYWNNDAKAIICGITRRTGKAELVKAGLDSIAYQITDIVKAMEQDTAVKVDELRVDGGATKNAYLMQFQSDLLSTPVVVPAVEELSGAGAAYMAGISCHIMHDTVFNMLQHKTYHPQMPEEEQTTRYGGWKNSVKMLFADR